MTHPCERCARTGDRQRIRAVESATLGRTVRVCRFDDECKPALVEVTRQAILEVRQTEGVQAIVTHLEEGGGHLRTRWRSEPMPLDQAIEEAGWRALCCAWRRRQWVVYRLRYGPNMHEVEPQGLEEAFGAEARPPGPVPLRIRHEYGPTSLTSTASVDGKPSVFHEHLVESPARPPPVPA